MNTISHMSERRGFTLIEMLIVITVVAILALIVVPRMMNQNRRAKESTMKLNLQRLRGAVEQFRCDAGVPPRQLSDLALPQGSSPEGITQGAYGGPYLYVPSGIIENGKSTGIPANPFISQSALITEHWLYYPDTGQLQSAYSGTTMDGIDYSLL